MTCTFPASVSAGSKWAVRTVGSAVSDPMEFGMLQSLAGNVHSCPHLCGDDINSLRLKHLPALTHHQDGSYCTCKQN